MVIEFISLLYSMATFEIKCFSNSLTRNKFFNCPELLFLKGMTGGLAPFKLSSYLESAEMKSMLQLLRLKLSVKVIVK